MSQTQQIPIYHITHLDNLPSIIADGGLWSDRRMATLQKPRLVIGYEHIKQRRLNHLPVHCHPGTMVGDYVPFYFCPRSPMLFKISKRGDDLSFRDGQDEVIHLVSTVEMAVNFAAGRSWAFSDGNAGAEYAQFSSDLAQLPAFVDWPAVNARWWRGPNVDPAIMSKKMAEFLVHDWFPWAAFQWIGVIGEPMANRVKALIANANHQPNVSVQSEWYY